MNINYTVISYIYIVENSFCFQTSIRLGFKVDSCHMMIKSSTLHGWFEVLTVRNYMSHDHDVHSKLQGKEDCQSIMFSMSVINGFGWIVNDNEDLK